MEHFASPFPHQARMKNAPTSRPMALHCIKNIGQSADMRSLLAAWTVNVCRRHAFLGGVPFWHNQ
jgi:hypothetical protein